MFSLSKTAKKTLPACLIINLLIICMIAQPRRYISSVSEGFSLFINNVAPSLLPFFIFTRLLTALGWSQLISQPFTKLVYHTYHCPPVAGYVAIMSLMSGYPIGAKLTSDLYLQGIITEKDAKKITTFASTSGPIFVIGAVGAMIFNDAKFGYILYFSHALGAIINGIFYRGKKTELSVALLPSLQKSQNILSETLTNSIISLALVGAYIALFSMIIDIIFDLKLVAILSYPLQFLLTLCHQPPQLAEGFIVGLFEITKGLKMLSQSGITPSCVLPYASALLSFGGVCIALQSMTFLKDCKISFGYYVLTKTTQATITFALSLLAVIIFY